jgi:GAF domain-containing protein
MALPLVVSDQLLGVLDIQSIEEAAFTNEDIEVLQVLANQVAIAIYNTMLFTENQAALERSRRDLAQESQRAWREMFAQTDLGFISLFGKALESTSSDRWTPEMVLASQEGSIVQVDNKTIAIPIILREEVLGVVRLKKTESQNDWTDEEINLMTTLIDQLEVALESARLYSDTQRRAAREQLVTEITTKIRAANDPQTMLQTAVLELRQALQAQRAQVLLGSKNNE